MDENLGHDPAFPVTENIGLNGMSKRFYAACAAMQGMLSNIDFLKGNADVAKRNGKNPDEFLIYTAYSLANELLKQENQ